MIEFKTKKELGSGLASTAYLLDDNYIQLVGKSEKTFETYKEIKSNADLLTGKITCVDYPQNMLLIEPNSDYPNGSLIYPIVKGNSLDAENATQEELDAIAKKLVEFNEQLHKLNIHWDREKSIKHELEKVDRNIEILKNYMTNNEISLLKKYEENFSECLNNKKSFCITHGDLWADNLIVDRENNLTGIIDFGNMAYLLPEVDYASLWNMRDGFLEKMLKYSKEDITLDSVKLFIMHRELCSFEYILSAAPEDVPSQLEKIRDGLRLINFQCNEIKK